MSVNKEIHEMERLLHELVKDIRHQHEFLHRIDQDLRVIRRKLFPIPNQITINLKESPMAVPKTYPIGTLISLAATEFDTLVTPPAPFPYAKGSVVYAQTGGAAVLVDNGDGTFSYPNTVAEVITVTATDAVSNPGTVLTDSAVITFQVAAQLPNQLNIVLP
jgi:hypothetical protein